MTRQEAIELLEFHSFSHGDIDNPKLVKGFLGMLRPYKGQLYEDNFLELMEVLKVLSDDLRKNNLDKTIVSNFWSICQLSRNWAIDEEGMLRKNNLLSGEQIEKISTWTDCISSTIMFLLDGSNDETAFETFKFYLDSNSSQPLKDSEFSMWRPVSLKQLEIYILQGELELNEEELNFWNFIKIQPEKWSEKDYGAEGGGFWVVAVFGNEVIYYNDIEEGFNVSEYKRFGEIENYRCNQSELNWIVKGIYERIKNNSH